MKEMITDMLNEYTQKLESNKKECYDLMKAGKDWKEHAKQGTGFILMIEAYKKQLSNIN